MDLENLTLQDVPTNGVIALVAQVNADGEQAIDTMDFIVTDSDGVEIAGAIEHVAAAGSHSFIVWRPSASLAPDAQYHASITTYDVYDSTRVVQQLDLEVTTGPGASVAPTPVVLHDPVVDGEAHPDGDRVCCSDQDCGDSCEALVLRDWPELTVQLTIGPDPMASQFYPRVLAGLDGEPLELVEVLELASGTDGTMLENAFETAGDGYCIGVELVSLIDGSVTDVVTQCAEHGGLELGSGPNPRFESFVQRCDDPHWEGSDKPYIPEPSGEDSSGEDSGSGEAGSESGDTGGVGGLDGDKAGCGCTASDRPGWGAGTALSLLAWITFARRRRGSEISGHAADNDRPRALDMGERDHDLDG